MIKPELDDCPVLAVDVDRLSDLPEPLLLHIFSFIPTKFAIRTSVLSRRFRHLWTASPSIDFDRREFPSGRVFTLAVSQCFHVRHPSAPLVNFSLNTYGSGKDISIISASKWLNRAYALGLRNLNLDVCNEDFESLFPLILTFHTLQSLRIISLDLNDNIRYPYTWKSLIPPNFLATGLKSLHLIARASSSDLKRLIMEQPHLEDLYLVPPYDIAIDLVSQSVKTLKLNLDRSYPEINLFFPALETMKLIMYIDSRLKKFNAEMPLLRKVDLLIPVLGEKDVPLLTDLLRSLTNVSHLSISIEIAFPKEQKPLPGLRLVRPNIYLHNRQFHLLTEPGKDLSTYPHLRSLKLLMHFHEVGISDLISFLHNAPVLESLELNHVDNDYLKDEGSWKSRLPPDSEGNNQHVHISNLHIGDRKLELIRILSVFCKERHQKKLKI